MEQSIAWSNQEHTLGLQGVITHSSLYGFIARRGIEEEAVCIDNAVMCRCMVVEI